MSSAAILVIAITVVAVLAVILLVTTNARRDRQSALGVLDREARRRDKSGAGLDTVTPEGVEPRTGKEIEQAAVLERTGGGTVAIPARSAPPSVSGPVDAETYGQTRRMFLNRSIVGLMVVSISGFGATLIAFLWPAVSAGFGAKINAGTVSDIQKTLASKQPFYNPVGRFYINPFP